MPPTLAVIGFSPNQLRRRTAVVPDSDAQVPALAAWLKSMGEAVLVAPLADCRALGFDAVLARQFSRPAASDRCAVVGGTGTVLAVVGADPKMDRHPLGRLVADPKGLAVVGLKALDVGLLS